MMKILSKEIVKTSEMEKEKTPTRRREKTPAENKYSPCCLGRGVCIFGYK
jgi:hypothetical protein